MKHICKRCGSDNVLQKWAAMIDPNDEKCISEFDATTLEYDDFEYCVDCEQETKTEESVD